MSSPNYESYTTQHTDITFDSFIRDNPVEVHAIITVDKTGDVEEIEIVKVFIKENKDNFDSNKVELNVDGLGSWNMDLDEGMGVYRDVLKTLEDEAYDVFQDKK